MNSSRPGTPKEMGFGIEAYLQLVHSITAWRIQDTRSYFCSKSPKNSDSGFTAETCN